MYQNLRAEFTAVLRGKFVELKAYIRGKKYMWLIL